MSPLPARAGHALYVGAPDPEPRPLGKSSFAMPLSAPHTSIIVAGRTEKEGNDPLNPLATDGNSKTDEFPVDLAMVISMALARAGLSHKEAADRMGLTPGQWSKQLRGIDGHHVSFPRLMSLGGEFRRALWQMLGEADGLAITHHDLADLTILRVCDLVQSLGSLAVQFRALRRIA